MRFKLWRYLCLLVTIVCVASLFAACGGNRSEDEAYSDARADVTTMEFATDENTQKEGAAERTETETEEAELAKAEERKVMYRAELTIEVKNFTAARDAIERIVNETDGYIVETSQYEEEHTIGGYLMVRVPQSIFTDFMHRVEKLADKVPHRQVSGSDVTEEYVDLESRLKAKKAVEKRLLALMENAEKTEDLLQISQDLGQVQEEIEQITGRMHYLDHQVDYAAVNIDITQTVIPRAVSGEKERHTLAAAWSAFVASINDVLHFFSRAIVFFARALPIIFLLTLIGIPAWIGWRKKSIRSKEPPRE